MGNPFAHTTILLRKNLLVAYQDRTLTACRLMTPIILISMFMFFSIFNQDTEGTKFVRNQEPEVIPVLPKCYVSDDLPACHTLLYNFKGHPAVEDVVSSIKRRAGYGDGDVLGIEGDKDTLNQYLLDNKNTSMLALAFTFNATLFPATLPPFGDLYQLEVNNTLFDVVNCRAWDYFECFVVQRDIYIPYQLLVSGAVYEVLATQKGLPVPDVAVKITPFAHPAYTVEDYQTGAGPFWFLIALLFPMVFEVMELTREKETKLKYALKVAGVRPPAIALSWIIYHIVFDVANVLLLILIGAVFQFKMILGCDFRLYFLTFLFLSFSNTAASHFIAAFFTKVKPARMVAMAYMIFFSLFAQFTFLIFTDSVDSYWKVLLSFFSPVLGGRAITTLFFSTLRGQEFGMSWSDRFTSEESPNYSIEQILGWLILDTVVYTFLAWFTSNVVADAMGVRQSPLFFITSKYWKSCLGSSKKTGNNGASMEELQESTSDLDIEEQQEDDQEDSDDSDVVRERERVNEDSFDAAVVVRNAVKTFTPLLGGTPFTAVNDVSLHVSDNELLCLLGPNGAGKTTLVNLLTGGLMASSGELSVAGYDVGEDIFDVRASIGVCPQFDIVWEELTALENLLLFCTVKGMTGKAIEEEAYLRLKEVELEEVAHKPVKSFSGGMKRRLSVAMAVANNPRVLFLDEPTTGMDPVSRRTVWTIIQNATRNRSVILTTHSMEEADALGDRVAIMANGRLRCIGTSHHLKEKFGSGYRILVLCNPEDLAGAKKAVGKKFPDLAVVATTATNFTLEVEQDNREILPSLFKYLQKHSLVDDFQITLTTLEDVFLKIAEDAKGEEFAHQNDNDAAMDVKEEEEERDDVETVVETAAKSQTFKALFRKTLRLQSRSTKTNVCQVLMPAVLIVIIVLIQVLVFDSQAVTEAAEPNPEATILIGTLIQQYFVVDAFASPLDFDAALTSIKSFASYGTGQQATTVLQGVLNNPAVTGAADVRFRWLDLPDRESMMRLTYDSHFFTDNDTPDLRYDASTNATLHPEGDSFVHMGFGISAETSTKFDVEVFFNRTLSYAFVPGAIEGIVQMYMISQGIADAPYMTSLSDFPLPERSEKSNILALISGILFPLILMFLLPVFVGNITHDKENRLLEIMKMMGLDMRTFWLVTWVFDMGMYMLTVTIIIIVGLASGMEMFILNTPLSWLLLFVLWGYCLISIAFLIAALTTKEMKSTVISYVFVFVSWLSGLILYDIVQRTNNGLYTFLFSLYPPFALIRGSFALSFGGWFGGIKVNLIDDFELHYVYLHLFIEGTIFYFLAWYLDQVLPATFGVPKHPLFLCRRSYWTSEAEDVLDLGVKEDMGDNEDSDVATAREIAWDSSEEDHAVRLLGLRKEFPGKVAVKCASFAVAPGECFGLLGHNGAGKTTIANMLSGLITPSSGTAIVDGFDIRNNMAQIHNVLGVCPQHDLLWPTMTAEEHLQLYGQLKGLSGKALDKQVDAILRRLNLHYRREKKCGTFSGGMKRRLSIGIAVIGSPKIIFLDEPTTGLDPKNRRDIWEVIMESSRATGAAVILTTHSMEEAEALCSRIGIMSAGELKVIGTASHLKSKFAIGYGITIVVDREKPDSVEAAIRFVEDVAPGVEHLDHSIGFVRHFYIADTESISIGDFFEEMEEKRRDYDIVDWTIHQTTLEDIFLQVSSGTLKKNERQIAYGSSGGDGDVDDDDDDDDDSTEFSEGSDEE